MQPCGVESFIPFFSRLFSILRFLMHRVELKALFLSFLVFLYLTVPNAPCGVESSINLTDKV